jgi:hypothetical protein
MLGLALASSGAQAQLSLAPYWQLANPPTAMPLIDKCYLESSHTVNDTVAWSIAVLWPHIADDMAVMHTNERTGLGFDLKPLTLPANYEPSNVQGLSNDVALLSASGNNSSGAAILKTINGGTRA